MQQTLPVPFYLDPAVYAEERRRIFGKSWQFMGLEADLDETGDFISRELAGFNVVAVRDQDGKIKAFHNVCRHRAGPLVDEPKGKCEGAFVCRYHGWRYMLDGRLRSATAFGAKEDFDPRDYGLHPLKLETWRGLVFVNADLDCQPLSALVAPLDAILGERTFPSEPYRESHPIACNWKVYVENYLEGYHVEMVHPTLAGQVEPSSYTVEMLDQIAVHKVQMKSGVASGLWAWMWPNLGFNVYHDGVMLEQMLPEGHSGTRLDYIYLRRPGDPEGPAAVESSTRLTVEDKWICEKVQANFQSGVYDQGVLSPRHEIGVAWFQDQVRKALEA